MSELDMLMQQITSKYPVETLPFRIGGKELKVLQVVDFEEHLMDLADRGDVQLADLPFWAKVWEASAVLAYYMGKQPVIQGQKILEIGAGIGIVGIYAALCGHDVAITDINEDALLFARATALLNGATNAKVCKLDWTDLTHIERYDMIIGSEVIYDRRSYPLLVDFLNRTLKPGGMVFLAKHQELNTPAFFAELTKLFEFKQTVQTVRTDGNAEEIVLYAIRRKKNANGDS